MKAFRPAFKRVERIASQAWTQMLQAHTCSSCYAPVQLQTLMPGESLPPHHLPDPTIRIFTKCHRGHFEGMAHIGLIIRFHPAVQNFIAHHPRYIYIADQCTEYAGQPAFRTAFADTQSAARLFAWVDVQSLQVLHTEIE